MFSSDKRKRKPKKSRRLRNNDSDSSPEKPIHPKELLAIQGRPQSSLLNIPLYPPSNAQNISLSNETGQPERVTKAEDNSGSNITTVAEIDAKSEYQKMGYTDKLSIAVQMVPELLAGDVKQALEQLLFDPAFVTEVVVAGVVFAGLQATPAGPLIDAVMVATLGVDVALKLGGFLYKSYTANDENDLKAAAEDLKGFIEIAGMAGATKLLGMAGRALKNLSGEATAVEGQAIPRLPDDEAANIWGAGPGQAKPSMARKQSKEQSHQDRLSRYEYDPKTRTDSQLKKDLKPTQRTGETSEQMQQRTKSAQMELNSRRIAELKLQGHGPQRHGPQLTETQLDKRVREKVDPETGTRLDKYRKKADGTPHNHKCGDHATKFNSERDYVKAEDHFRNSSDFKDRATRGEPRIAVHASLEEIYGPGYKNAVSGSTRQAPWPDTSTPTQPTNFTDGRVTAYYQRNSSGSYDLITMYPEPR
jgi:hypothetical protein